MRHEFGASSDPVPRSDVKPQAKRAGPCAIVIFGAAGDLTRRLLVPALYNLGARECLPEEFAVIGIARTSRTARRSVATSAAACARS